MKTKDAMAEVSLETANIRGSDDSDRKKGDSAKPSGLVGGGAPVTARSSLNPLKCVCVLYGLEGMRKRELGDSTHARKPPLPPARAGVLSII